MIGIRRHLHAIRMDDDRGEPCSIPSPYFEGRPEPDAVFYHRLAMLRRDARRPGLTRVACVGLLALAILAVMFGAVEVLGTGRGNPIGLDALIYFALAIACVLLAAWWPGQLRRSLARMEARRPGLAARCPACRYDLARLPPEPDGCTVCPECGAAWRLTNTEPEQKEKTPH